MSDEEHVRIRDPESPATENQRRWLTDHGVDPNAANDQRLTKGRASEWIDQIKGQPPEQRQIREPAPLPSSPPMARPPDAGPPERRDPEHTSRELAPEPGETPAFVSAAEMASAYLVTPVVPLQQMKDNWTAIREFRRFILDDEECFDIIEGSKEMNRTGATRLAMAFGLSLEERSIDAQEFTNDQGKKDVRFIVRVRVGRGQRFADGVGSAHLSEIPEKTKEKGRPGDKDYRPARDVPFGQRWHFAYTRAFTRAHKRAIADILGGTEAE